MRWSLLLLLCSTFLLGPSPRAYAADDEDEEEEDALEDEGGSEEQDDEEIYKEYREDRRGESPDEEADAWQRYLETYPNSAYRMEIERRLKALQEAAYAELKAERQKGAQKKEDAKAQEFDVREFGLLTANPNPRKRFSAAFLWGYPSTLHYNLTFEWAFLRNLSAWASVRNNWKGFGGHVQIGAKYAVVKDKRVGVILTPMFSIEVGGGQLEGGAFRIEPGLGFSFVPNKTFQLNTALSFQLRVPNPHTALIWDIAAVIFPTDVFGIYVESKQKHSLYQGPLAKSRYFGFHQAGVGVKIVPAPIVEITVGANIPYLSRVWVDYRYIGAHAGLTFNLGKTAR